MHTPHTLSLQEFANELSMPFLETSARTAANVEQAFITMATELIQLKYIAPAYALPLRCKQAD